MSMKNGKWLRKYKIFFLIGLAIFSCQIFLACRFFNLNKSQERWDLPSVSQIIQKPHHNGTVLKLDELGFKPNCEINWKEAVSAINRAKSQKCKRYISDIACQSVEGSLYPKKIQSLCPSPGRQQGKDLGCFKDERKLRLLNGYFGTYKNNNSPDFCIQLCLQSGFIYSGVQYSNECFCGHDEPPASAKLPDSSCNMKCPGDNHAICGGYYTINIYETGIERFKPQVAKTEVNRREKPVKIVFLLTINGRALRQVKRLIKILYHQDHYYYIHVDVREDYLFRELLPLEELFPNIRLTRRRFATIWGGASLLEMLLNCMNELLKIKNWHWDFILNLSESDYPVKRVNLLQNFLTSNKNKNFVKSHGRDTQRFLQKQGLDKTFVECDYRMWRVADRKLPHGIQMDGGSDWIALSRSFVNYVANDEIDNLVNELKTIFKFTLLPAESFFHTVLRNSKFCHTYIDNNLHVTNWKRKLGCKCQYKHVVDWCGCSPNDFRMNDWIRIQTTQSRQLYFARKFEPIINQAIILKLELWLYNLDKPTKYKINLHGYWQSLYHHLDLSPPSILDDGLKTIGFSAARNWAKSLFCNYTIDKLPKEIHTYHYKDEYKFTLVHFILNTSNNIQSLELAFKPMQLLKIIPNILLVNVDEFIVSSDYDQKEQLSRNFARILSPYSDLYLIYKFSSANNNILLQSINISCMWIDPNGQLVDLSEISLDDSGIGYLKGHLKPPNLPGIWTVRLFYKNNLFIEMNFLITPLQFFGSNDQMISKNHAYLLHGGDKLNNYSKRYGQDLLDWIDDLFNKYFIIENICSINNKINICGITIENCIKTNWSSYAYDPKSAIIDNSYLINGTFDIW